MRRCRCNTDLIFNLDECLSSIELLNKKLNESWGKSIQFDIYKLSFLFSICQWVMLWCNVTTQQTSPSWDRSWLVESVHETWTLDSDWLTLQSWVPAETGPSPGGAGDCSGHMQSYCEVAERRERQTVKLQILLSNAKQPEHSSQITVYSLKPS